MSEQRYRQPDQTSPTINGYFRIPAIWVGEAPPLDQVRLLNSDIHHQTVIRRDLRCGIKARVQRDGLFAFDFSGWHLAPSVVIPGFDVPVQTGSVGIKVPRTHLEAENKAAESIVFRAKVLNVHQACLTTAERTIFGRGAKMGFPVHSREMHHEISLDAPLSYSHNTELPRSMSENVLNNAYNINWAMPPSRRVIEIAVIERSLDQLDEILVRHDPRLVEIIESFYIASVRGKETRLGEALTIAWAACEQLLSIAWKRLLDSDGAQPESVPMTKVRRAKFNGRDYTASVIVEILALSDQLDGKLYSNIESARKARNRWAHDMASPSIAEAHAVLSSLQQLLLQVLDVRLQLQLGAEIGSFPQWPVSMLKS